MNSDRVPSESIRQEAQILGTCAAVEDLFEVNGLDKDGYYPDEAKPLYLDSEAIAFVSSVTYPLLQMVGFDHIDGKLTAITQPDHFLEVTQWPCRHRPEILPGCPYLICHTEERDGFFVIYALPVKLIQKNYEKIHSLLFGWP